MRTVFEITRHALERYTERVLGVKEDEANDYINNNREDLIDTISSLIMKSDLIFSDYRTIHAHDNGEDNIIYFVYKDIIFVLVQGHIRTIYPCNIKDLDEIQQLKELIVKHRKADGHDSIVARNYATVLIGHSLLKGII